MHLGADRIWQIVLGLRNFSRLDEAEMKLVDIHEGIDNTLLILQHRLKTTKCQNCPIQVFKEFDNLPLLECYPDQLNQVFMNILSNAIDALEAGTKTEEQEWMREKTLPTSSNTEEKLRGEASPVYQTSVGIYYASFRQLLGDALPAECKIFNQSD